MALRMVDDPQDSNDYNENTSNRNVGGGGGAGLGGLLSFLPLIFSLFGKRGNSGNDNGGSGKGGCGKYLIWILIIGVGGYFLLTRTSCLSGITDTVSNNLFSNSGYSYNPDEFAKASVYEGLADDNTKNPLPEAVSLAAFAPQRMDQGKQGSCVAWSSAYAAGTILEAASSRENPNQVAFSPAFMYNYIALENCQGSYLQKAMEFMQKNGSVAYRDFQYNEDDCSRQASQDVIQKASQNKIHGFHRLTESDGVGQINVRAIKEHLAKDAPVVIGMMVGGSFLQGMMGQKVWHPTNSDAQQVGFGGHAMCIIGYDDRLEGGAFQIMNSWGPQWGENGIAFVRYADFTEYAREAYGLDPLPKKGAALNVPLECTVGMVNNETRQPIALRTTGNNIFQSIAPIKKGTKFKMQITNKSECYLYIFTPDLQNKSVVLFPYKPIHSAYCGITGYRLFPRKESIQADDVGNQEVMAIVVSKTELDYNQVNASINAASGASYADKVNAALKSNIIPSTRFSTSTDGSVNFSAPSTSNGVVAAIVQMAKQ